MITKIGRAEFHIRTIGGEIDITMGEDDLIERLSATGYWSEAHLDKIRQMEVGDETPRPKGIYV